MAKKDLKSLSEQDLHKLCQEIRDQAIDFFSKEGGYLSDNLAAVDVTVQLQKVFGPDDLILFSKNHLSYAQKYLYDEGYCSYFYDHISLAETMGVISASSRHLKDSHVVYVMSDQDLLDFQLIKQMQENDLKLIIIYLDRHDKDVNALNKIINGLRQTEMYNGLKKGVKKSISNMRSSEQIISGIHRFKDSVKKAIIDEDVFDRYNIDYLGPINGHDHKQLSKAFNNVKKNSRLVVVHCLVKPGKGYPIAEKGEMPTCTMPFNRKDGRPFMAENDRNLKPNTIIRKTIEKLLKENSRILCISNDALEYDGMADLFAGYPTRCMQVKMNNEDLLRFVKGTMIAGMLPCVCIGLSAVADHVSLLNEIASLKTPALFYACEEESCSWRNLSQIRDAYVIKTKDAADLQDAVYTFDKINKPLIIITEKQCLAYEKKEPVRMENLGKWDFLVNNEKGKALILGCGSDLVKLADIISANELPYDLIDCQCINIPDSECLSQICKKYKHIYYFGKNDRISDLIGSITVIDSEMEEIFARIKKDLHA